MGEGKRESDLPKEVGWFDPLQMKPTPQRPELSFLFLPGIPMRRETT